MARCLVLLCGCMALGSVLMSCGKIGSGVVEVTLKKTFTVDKRDPAGNLVTRFSLTFESFGYGNSQYEPHDRLYLKYTFDNLGPAAESDGPGFTVELKVANGFVFQGEKIGGHGNWVKGGESGRGDIIFAGVRGDPVEVSGIICKALAFDPNPKNGTHFVLKLK